MAFYLEDWKTKKGIVIQAVTEKEKKMLETRQVFLAWLDSLRTYYESSNKIDKLTKTVLSQLETALALSQNRHKFPRGITECLNREDSAACKASPAFTKAKRCLKLEAEIAVKASVKGLRWWEVLNEVKTPPAILNEVHEYMVSSVGQPVVAQCIDKADKDQLPQQQMLLLTKEAISYAFENYGPPENKKVNPSNDDCWAVTLFLS